MVEAFDEGQPSLDTSSWLKTGIYKTDRSITYIRNSINQQINKTSFRQAWPTHKAVSRYQRDHATLPINDFTLSFVPGSTAKAIVIAMRDLLRDLLVADDTPPSFCFALCCDFLYSGYRMRSLLELKGSWLIAAAPPE